MALFEKGIKKVVLPAAAAAGVMATPEESEAGIIKSFIDIARAGATRADRAKLFVDAHKTMAPTGFTKDQYREKLVEQLLKENPDIEKSLKRGDAKEAVYRMLEKVQQDPTTFEVINRADFVKSSTQDDALRKILLKDGSNNENLLKLKKQALAEESRGFYNPATDKTTIFIPEVNKPITDILGTTGHEIGHKSDKNKLYDNVIDPTLKIPDDMSENTRRQLEERYFNVPGGLTSSEELALTNKHYNLLPHILNKKDPEKAQRAFKMAEKLAKEGRLAARTGEEIYDTHKPEYFYKKLMEVSPVYFPDVGIDEVRSMGHIVSHPEGFERTVLRNSIVDKTPILDLSNFSSPSKYKKSAAAVAGVLGANALGSEARASTIGEPGNFSSIPKEMQEAEEPKNTGFVWKALDALSYPQRAAFNTAASVLGTKGDIENSEKSAQAIVENLAERAGIPEDSTVGNAAKALGVAGLEVMTDPADLLGLGTLNKGAKAGRKAWKALKKVNK